jgi:hypothetical protein
VKIVKELRGRVYAKAAKAIVDAILKAFDVSRFGLHTSSGLRPGSITSSGNVSYHSSGDAVDEAGSPGNMRGGGIGGYDPTVVYATRTPRRRTSRTRSPGWWAVPQGSRNGRSPMS